jgi:hypothetical protein
MHNVLPQLHEPPRLLLLPSHGHKIPIELMPFQQMVLPSQSTVCTSGC